MHKNHHMEQLGDERREIDERWFAQWVAMGHKDIELYLRRHARFDAYLKREGR